ncbi:type I-C CRISPR-associated protein Cas8c/Csd1, partial [uncultured Ruminococcus sp.]|uniref:type I-C CRISPR-associated protein Cas8c/Csd1 n=1 Tax=uncultured Ruminococcus sp. TaxID=165186 RepID=UPI0025F37DC5
MLIQALCSYADQLAERAGGQKIPDGWSEQKISFEVLLTPEGKIGDILDIRNAVETPQKNGKTKITYSPRTCLLPLRTQVTGICSNTIEHRPLYLFGLNLDQGELKPCDKTNKAKKSHDAFVVHNQEFFQDLDSEICQAFYAFLQNWNPESETENPHLKKCGALYKNNYFCFGLQSDPNVRLENDPAFR